MPLLNDMVDYSLSIVDKKIVACKKHIWSCQRFLNDLDDENFDFYFDEAKAQRFLNWFEQFKHQKGVLAGQKIKAHPIQKLIFGNIYGWYSKEDDLRRFNKGYWQVARKNAKTQSLAGVGTYELSANGEESSEVYIAATKRDQAKILWKNAMFMLNSVEAFKGKFKFSYNTILHIKTDSEMKALTQEDKKTGDGLNPQCGLVDEYHAHSTDDYYEIIESGMMARSQPLMFIITTAGFELENPCYRIEYDYVSKILNPGLPDVNNNAYYVMINELDMDKNGNLIDDVMDESCYLKANPILASYPQGLKNLKEKAKAANDSTEKLRKFLTKNMNVWVSMGENQYMDMVEWNKSIVDSVELYNKTVYVGLDLSLTIDITSIGFVVVKELSNEGAKKYYSQKQIDSGRNLFLFEIFSKSFMPEKNLYKKIKTDRVPYDEWIKEGFIIMTPGKEVDYIYMEEWLLNFLEVNELEVEGLCFDKWNSNMFAQSVRNKTGIECIDIGQNFLNLSEPTKKFRAMLYNGRVKIENNKLLNFAVSNAIEKKDSHGNIMLDKEKSRKRIDPIASIINAVVKALADIESQSEFEIIII